MTTTMISSMPSMAVGIDCRTDGRVSSSFRHGTCTTSFMAPHPYTSAAQAPVGARRPESRLAQTPAGWSLHGTSAVQAGDRAGCTAMSTSVLRPHPGPAPGGRCCPHDMDGAVACLLVVLFADLRAAPHDTVTGAGTTTRRTTRPGTSCTRATRGSTGGHGARPRGRPRGVDVDHGGRERPHRRPTLPRCHRDPLPAYWIAQADSMTVIPGVMAAALACALGIMMMFLGDAHAGPRTRHALVACGVLAFATPVWTVAADAVWPHTVTVLGIGGMAWASATRRWWLVGLFGGVTLWGRLHAAIIVAVVGLLLGWWRRSPRITLVIAAWSAASCWLWCRCGRLVDRVLEPGLLVRCGVFAGGPKVPSTSPASMIAVDLASIAASRLDTHRGPSRPPPSSAGGTSCRTGPGRCSWVAWPTR